MTTRNSAPRDQPDDAHDVPDLRLPQLAPVRHLGEQCIAGRSPTRTGEQPVERRDPARAGPLRMTRTRTRAGWSRLRHTVPGSILYSSYWYRSGDQSDDDREPARDRRAGVSLVGGFEPETWSSTSAATTERSSTAIGTRRPPLPRDRPVGRDALRRREGLRRHQRFLPHERARGDATRPARPGSITSIAMFYDLEQPARVRRATSPRAGRRRHLGDASSVHADDARDERFDTICHEHLEYYSLAVIERLLAEAGLEVVARELNDINGGSIRLFAGHAGPTSAPEQREALHGSARPRSSSSSSTRPRPTSAFARGAERVRDELRALLRTLQGRGQEDPRLRRLDQGQHDPPVRRHRHTR